MTNRQHYLEQYTTDENDIITDLGKFEGEPLYVPYFWDCYLEGGADDDDGETLRFDLNDTDIQIWPEPKNWKCILLFERSDGFVSHQVIR